MIVKQKTSPKPVYAESGEGIQPLRCTSEGELVVHQVNNPEPLDDFVKLLRSIWLDPDGAMVVRDKDRTVSVEGVVKTEGKVCVENTLTMNPVMVSNMPDKIQIQEPLCIAQMPLETMVAPIDFEGYESVILEEPARIYQIHLTVCEPTIVEVVGITGSMYTDRIDINLFPLFVSVEELIIKVRESSLVGGYVIYDNQEG